jgi:CubicO group peptidase (beta-lactamase class C family)
MNLFRSHRLRSFWVLGLALLLPGCADSGTPGAGVEASDWVRGDAAAAGFDVAALEELAAEIEAGDFPNTHAVLVEHDGELIFERYFSGPDERWGEAIPDRVMGPDSLHDLRSISKSVTSALLGIALGDDFEAALVRPAKEYLPDLDLAGSAQGVTLHHVLTMTMGLEWNEMTVPYTDPTNDEIRLYEASDPAAEVLTRPAVHEPGSTWYYSGGSTQVLASIITEMTGQSLDDFANEHLFAPMGVQKFEWLGPDGWSPDNPAAMSGLRLTARDLAKLGSVYLHRGMWQGTQIVPEEWVTRSMERHVPEIGDWSNGGMWGYGYQWWVGDWPSGHRVVAGVGNGNQRLFVVPSERLVVTVFAGQYNAFSRHSDQILERVIAARQ